MSEDKMQNKAPSGTLKAALTVMVAATAYYFMRNKATAILPNIAGALDGMAYYTWATMVYGFAACITAPLWGKIGDMLGRKKVLIILLATMAVGDMTSGLAPNIFVFIVGYGITGIGGGGMMATYYALLGDLFDPDKRGKYGGIMLMISNVITIFLPILAALFTDKASWRYIFFLTSAVYIIALALVIFLLPKSEPTGKTHKIDWIGVILITGAAVPILLALSWAGSLYPFGTPVNVALLSVGVVFLIAAIIFERKHADYALLSIKLLRNPNYTFAIMVSLFMTSTMTGWSTFGSLFVQGVMGYSPTIWASAQAPASFVAIFAAGLSGWAMDKTKRYKWLLILAPLCGTITMAAFLGMSPTTPIIFITALTIFNKVFTGYMPSVNTLAAMAQIEPVDFGAGNGTLFFITSLGGAVYPAVYGSLLNGLYASNIAKFTASLSLNPAQIKAISTSRVLVTPAALAQLKTSFGANVELYNKTFAAVRNALQSTLVICFIVAGLISFGSVIMAVLIKEVPLDQVKYAKKK